MQGAAPGRDHPLEFEPVGYRRLAVHANDDDGPLCRTAVLEQGADRRYPDAPGDEHHGRTVCLVRR